MAKRRSSVDIAAEQEVLRAQAMELAEAEGTDEEVEANIKRSQEMLDEYDELDAERVKAIEYEKRVEAVRAAALIPAQRETGDGAAQAPVVTRTRTTELLTRTDPWDGLNLRTATKSDLISRAMTLIEGERRVPLSDLNRGWLDDLVHRADESDDADNPQFDGSYVAARALLTENKAYRSAFRKYVKLGNLAQFNAEESRAISALQDYELGISRAASEGTTTAGGFGVPVKLAA